MDIQNLKVYSVEKDFPAGHYFSKIPVVEIVFLILATINKRRQ